MPVFAAAAVCRSTVMSGGRLNPPSEMRTDWSAAGAVDTSLGVLRLLERHRTDRPERRVTARRVVEPLDAVEHMLATDCWGERSDR
jgi:hypothetical protein